MSDFVTISSWAWAVGLVGLALAGFTYRYVKGQPSGSEAMGALAEQIHDGAMAFLRREYLTLVPFVIVMAIVLWLLVDRYTGDSWIPRTAIPICKAENCGNR